MTFVLDGTPEQAMSAFAAHLERAHARGPDADHEARMAMVSLVRLYDRQAAVGPVAPERLQQFRAESAAALVRTNLIPAYVLKALFLAEGANDNQWYELSMRRSAIQSLIDDYRGTPVEALVSLDDVAQLDDELRALGQHDEQGAVDEHAIPRGLPETHWWWRYPDQFK
jgi:hypothetical protein